MSYWRFACLGIVDVGGWLVVGCWMLIGGLSEANSHGIQYPPAQQTADTKATQTLHGLMCRSCVPCLVVGWLVDGWWAVAYLWFVIRCLGWSVVALSRANAHDIQYPPAQRTADTKATETLQGLIYRSCVRCLVSQVVNKSGTKYCLDSKWWY